MPAQVELYAYSGLSCIHLSDVLVDELRFIIKQKIVSWFSPAEASLSSWKEQRIYYRWRENVLTVRRSNVLTEEMKLLSSALGMCG